MTAYRNRPMAALALSALVLGLAGAASAAEVATLRYGIDDEKNINRLPQVIAEREGFFAREGLRVQIVPFTSSFRAPAAGNSTTTAAGAATVREGMETGAVDMSRQQLPLLINDGLTGRVKGRFVGVSLAASNPVYFLVVRPEIKSFADLKGKRVTLTGLHDAITLWTRELLELHGVGKNDVQVRSIAGSEGRLACMKSGECAAASMAQPTVFEALDAGYHTLGVTNEIAPLLYQLDIVNPVWAAAHRDTIVKYIRATTAANRFILDPRNREAVVRVTMAYMGEPETRTRQMLSAVWDPKNRVFAQRPEIDMNNVRATIALLGEHGILNPPLPHAEQYVDPSYASAAGK